MDPVGNVGADQRVGIKGKQGTLTRQDASKLGRQIKRSLRDDRIERMHRAEEAMPVIWAQGEEKESWQTTPGWYW